MMGRLMALRPLHAPAPIARPPTDWQARRRPYSCPVRLACSPRLRPRQRADRLSVPAAHGPAAPLPASPHRAPPPLLEHPGAAFTHPAWCAAHPAGPLL
jgi:hypothetical protein